MEILEWIANPNNVDTSSRTMWLGITGIMEKPEPMSTLFYVPMDKADFSRCLALVRNYNVSKSQLDKIKIPFPWFAPIIDHWDELVKLYDQLPIYSQICEYRTIEKHMTEDRCLYSKLQELRRECMKLDHYVEKRPGYWQKDSITA